MSSFWFWLVIEILGFTGIWIVSYYFDKKMNGKRDVS